MRFGVLELKLERIARTILVCVRDDANIWLSSAPCISIVQRKHALITCHRIAFADRLYLHLSSLQLALVLFIHEFTGENSIIASFGKSSEHLKVLPANIPMNNLHALANYLYYHVTSNSGLLIVLKGCRKIV